MYMAPLACPVQDDYRPSPANYSVRDKAILQKQPKYCRALSW